MSTTTMAAAAGSRSTADGTRRPQGLTSTAEQRVRTLAPTIFCAASEVEQCIEQAEARRAT